MLAAYLTLGAVVLEKFCLSVFDLGAAVAIFHKPKMNLV